MSCRAISVILGDKWKKMKSEERRMYTLEAKVLAEEQKRLNPDCWKRKRTNSVREPLLLDWPLMGPLHGALPPAGTVRTQHASARW